MSGVDTAGPLGGTAIGSAADLRFRFGLIMAVALLPLLLFSVWQSVVDYREDRRARAVALDASARLSVDGLMGTVEEAFLALDILAGSVEGTDCVEPFREVLDASREIDHLVLADAEGSYVCSAYPLDSRAQAFQLAKTLTPVRPTHVEIRRPPAGSNARPVVVLSQGDFAADGSLQRILLAGINLSRLGALSDSDELAADNDVAVLSRGGDVLYRSSRIFPALDPVLFADLTEGRRRIPLRDGEGRPRDVVVLPTDEAELLTAISAPRTSLLSWQALNPLTSALLPVLAWLFAFGAIWIAADKLILSHLRQLRHATLRFADGDAGARVGVLPDAPEQIRQLGSTFDLMAARIAEREASLQNSLAEKSVLLREIHHRVKNNLQIIISLLNMQQRELHDEEGRQAIEEARNRVGAIALVHRSLYESDDLQDVDMKPFLDQLVADLYRSHRGRARGVQLSTDLAGADLGGAGVGASFSSELAIPLALFVVEAVSNAIKHGVPDGGHVDVTFRESGTKGLAPAEHTDESGAPKRILSVLDSGPGPGEDVEASTGWRLMKGFARQLGGEFETRTTPKGFEVRLVF